MNKILLAVDGVNLSMPALDFACFLGRLTKSQITGVFLDNVEKPAPVMAALTSHSSTDWQLTEKPNHWLEKGKAIEQNIVMFKRSCERRSVGFKIHRERGVPAKKFVEESRFADLMVVDPATSFKKNFEGTPTKFVKDVLKEAECPVVIAPGGFDGIDEIIFTYDGNRSSILAIRQFYQLFPELKDKKVILLQVNEEGKWKDNDKYKLAEWLQCHYSAVEFVAVKGNVENGLFDYLFKRKNIFVVMGAYGRNPISGFFKPSHAEQIIKVTNHPIFISHY